MQAIQLPELSAKDLNAIALAHNVLRKDGCTITEHEGDKFMSSAVILSKEQAAALADILALVLEANDFWSVNKQG